MNSSQEYAGTTSLRPLDGVKVIEIANSIAGSLSGQLLCDAGADVVLICANQSRNAYPDEVWEALDRGKSIINIDLSEDETLGDFESLLALSDVLISDFPLKALESLGLNQKLMEKVNSSLIRVSITGFSVTDPLHDQTIATEGVIAALSGMFREISPARQSFGLSPVFTSIPLPSVYGAMHAVTATVAALIAKTEDGQGEEIEIPLFDSAMSALGGLLMKIENQPQRYDIPPISKFASKHLLPKIAWAFSKLSKQRQENIAEKLSAMAPPLFQFYHCKDGRQLFICAVEHRIQTSNCLETFGVKEILEKEGLEIGNVLGDARNPNNVMVNAHLSRKWQKRIHELIQAKAKTKPAEEWETLLEENSVPAGVVRSSDEWMDIPLLNEKGLFVELSSADGATIRQPGPIVYFSDNHPSSYLRPFNQTTLDVVLANWRKIAKKLSPEIDKAFDRKKGLLSNKTVVDFANVVAGPAAARTLGELGAEVVKIDPPEPQIGPRMTMHLGIDCSQGKRAIIVDMFQPEGKEIVYKLLDDADLILHNYLDQTCKNLGIDSLTLNSSHPHLSILQISAFGSPIRGGWENRPAFDPVIQVTSGIASRYGTQDSPVLHAIFSCIDYLTGYAAAYGSVCALYNARVRRKAVQARTSLSAVANYIQFPFVIRKDDKALLTLGTNQTCLRLSFNHGIYQTRDGWVYIEGSEDDVASIVPKNTSQRTPTTLDRTLEELFRSMCITEVIEILQKRNVAVSPVNNFEMLRRQFAQHVTSNQEVESSVGSIKVLHYRHKSGYNVATMAPSWMRISGAKVNVQEQAPTPGEDTYSILDRLGYKSSDQESLTRKGIVRTSYKGVNEYLPR